jgi:hypothetical protein
MISILILYHWSSELDIRKYSIFIYFCVSTWVEPLYTQYTKEGKFELLFPFGFIVTMLYLIFKNNKQTIKWKASFLGLFIGLIKIIGNYLF